MAVSAAGSAAGADVVGELVAVLQSGRREVDPFTGSVRDVVRDESGQVLRVVEAGVTSVYRFSGGVPTSVLRTFDGVVHTFSCAPDGTITGAV